MSTSPINAVTNGLARICGAHVGKAKFEAHVRALLEEVDIGDLALRQVETIDDIDACVGIQLDVIGALVGQPRRLTAAIINSYFGFEPLGGGEYQLALPMGDDDIPGLGGQFFDDGGAVSASADMLDVDYRKAIKARILYNNTRQPTEGTAAHCDSLFQVLHYILPDAGSIYLPGYPLHVQDDGGMHITIGIGKNPSQQERALLLYANVLPVPSGVGVTFVYWDSASPSVYPFGFEGMANVIGFGDDDHPETPGGIFAEEM